MVLARLGELVLSRRRERVLLTDFRAAPPFQDYLITYPTPYGSITPLYAGTAPEAAAYNGKVRALTTE